MFSIGLTDHLEGPAERSSAEIYQEVAEFVELADALGVEYAWFAEHHAHAHCGHLPTPLLFASHLAGLTKRIRLGTAIICLNLHHPRDVAEQVAVADVLSGGRMSPGFGSGSTPEEVKLFGLAETSDIERHVEFLRSLRIIRDHWTSAFQPAVQSDLPNRCWVAVNSAGSARIAGEVGFNMLFSHLRTPEQYRDYIETYRAAGGRGIIATNRPVYVGPDDATAWRVAEPMLRTLWRRFQREGKIAAGLPEPASIEGLCDHPINFIVGGPESVARQLMQLHQAAPFDVANLELRWEGLTHAHVLDSLRRLMKDAVPILLRG